MTRIELHTDEVLVNERDLQRLIDEWPDRASHGWHVAGGPEWLRNLRSPHRTPGRSHLDEFIPDAVFAGDPVYVFELKHSPQYKFESMALPEALHHAWMMVNVEAVVTDLNPQRKRVHPVIMSRFNTWLRASLQFLHDAGLSHNALTLLEFQAFPHKERRFLWVGNPLAPLRAVPEPKFARCLDAKYPHWYERVGESSLLATMERLSGTDGATDGEIPAPAFIPGQHAEFGKLEAQPGEPTEEFIMSEGSYTAPKDPKWTYWLLLP